MNIFTDDIILYNTWFTMLNFYFNVVKKMNEKNLFLQREWRLLERFSIQDLKDT